MDVLEIINSGFNHRYLNEMAEPRSKIVSRIESQYDALLEHSIKAFVYKDDRENYNDYITTIANILNYCDGQFAKTRTGKLKEKEYLELLFGVNNTYSFLDARNQLWTFQMKKGKDYPPFERSKELIEGFYRFYSNLSNYFSNLIASDREDRDRMNEFKNKVDELIRQ